MKRLAGFVLLAFLAGCGGADRVDNSHIQTPNEQPLGLPRGVGDAKTPKELTSASGHGGGQKLSAVARK